MVAEEQVCVIFAGVRGFIDKVATNDISKFEQKFLAHLRGSHQNLLDKIRKEGKLADVDETQLSTILESFIPEAGLNMKS